MIPEQVSEESLLGRGNRRVKAILAWAAAKSIRSKENRQTGVEMTEKGEDRAEQHGLPRNHMRDYDVEM